MKEATGEANLTVITIIMIGTILPTFYLVIPRIMNNIKDKACCISNNGTIEGNTCLIKSGKIKSTRTDIFSSNKYTDVTEAYKLNSFNNRCK